MDKKIWITWESQRRNRTLSSALDATLFEFNLHFSGWRRYLVALYKTVMVILTERPSIIFAQNPSLVLALVVVNLGKVIGIPTIVDAHNAGLFPFDGSREWVNRLALHILRRATVTLVTNEPLQRYVIQEGGAAFVLPDPIPQIDASGSHGTPLRGRVNILFICTYAADEPYIEVIKAAQYLERDIVIYMTGRTNGKEQEFKSILPENVVVTGYLSESEFLALLRSVDFVIDLTTRENCLLCGAYEGVAVEKPLILSDTKALRNYFSMGAVYTDNTAKDLHAKIVKAIATRKTLQKEVKVLKQTRTDEWEARRQCFLGLLGTNKDPAGIRARFMADAESSPRPHSAGLL